MECTHCKRVFAEDDRVVSIAGSIMGDEHCDVYFLCPACNLYSVAEWWDNFTGVETCKVSGPLSKEEGDKRVKLIRMCAEPWDKTCRCDAHRAYFNDTLD